MREKQNHIEQLLLERELEKQEAETQIIAYQKDINQVCIVDVINNRVRTVDISLALWAMENDDDTRITHTNMNTHSSPRATTRRRIAGRSWCDGARFG